MGCERKRRSQDGSKILAEKRELPSAEMHAERCARARIWMTGQGPCFRQIRIEMGILS